MQHMCRKSGQVFRSKWKSAKKGQCQRRFLSNKVHSVIPPLPLSLTLFWDKVSRQKGSALKLGDTSGCFSLAAPPSSPTFSHSLPWEIISECLLGARPCVQSWRWQNKQNILPAFEVTTYLGNSHVSRWRPLLKGRWWKPRCWPQTNDIHNLGFATY